MSIKTLPKTTKTHLGQNVLVKDNLINILDESKGNEQSLKGMKMLDILLNQTVTNTIK